ncbi:MAG TPA: hypothetical protein VGL36_35940 [Kribbella sp.]
MPGRRSAIAGDRDRDRGDTVSPAGRRTDGRVVIPAGLTGPVDVVLAKATERIPGPHDLVGGTWYEPKWDGFLH